MEPLSFYILVWMYIWIFAYGLACYSWGYYLGNRFVNDSIKDKLQECARLAKQLENYIKKEDNN